MSEQLHFECKACGVHLHGSFVNLCRNVEQLVEVDANTVVTDISDCQGQGEWCLQCGETAPLQALAALGIAPIPCEPDPDDAPCALCRKTIVRQSEPHVAFVISEDYIDGQSIGVDEVRFVSPVCAECAKPLVSGGAMDVPTVLGLAPAANDVTTEGGAA